MDLTANASSSWSLPSLSKSSSSLKRTVSQIDTTMVTSAEDGQFSSATTPLPSFKRLRINGNPFAIPAPISGDTAGDNGIICSRLNSDRNYGICDESRRPFPVQHGSDHAISSDDHLPVSFTQRTGVAVSSVQVIPPRDHALASSGTEDHAIETASTISSSPNPEDDEDHFNYTTFNRLLGNLHRERRNRSLSVQHHTRTSNHTNHIQQRYHHATITYPENGGANSSMSSLSTYGVEEGGGFAAAQDPVAVIEGTGISAHVRHGKQRVVFRKVLPTDSRLF